MALITIFGGSGAIGRQVVKLLAHRGYQVRIAVRNPQAALFLKPMGDVGQITPVQANLRNAASVRSAVAKADLVINLVGILVERGTQRFDTIQSKGATLVAEAARDLGAKSLIYLSAICASAASPSEYARSKAAGEAATMEIFPDAVILRPSVVFGPHDKFFNRFAAMSQLPFPLPVFGCGPPKLTIDGFSFFGSGGTRFQPVYVGDVAQAIVNCLECNDAKGKIFELGGPRIYSFCEILDLVLRETRRQRLLIPIPFSFAKVLGFFAEFLPKPILTRDQVKQLSLDNVVTGNEKTLADLGIKATAAEVVLPQSLETFRRGGRYVTTHPI